MNIRGALAVIAVAASIVLTVAAHLEAADTSPSPSPLAKWDVKGSVPSNFSAGVQRITAVPGTPLDLTFYLGPNLSEGPYKALEYSSQQWYESTFWTGPDWTRVGDRWHHPGDLTPSIRRFSVPRDGKVSITGRVFKLHLNGDGVRAAVHHNDREIWSVEIEGKDAEGVDPKLSLQVRKGDSLRFIVGKRVAISCDTTGWDPIITYEDGTAFRASKSFGKQQGAGHWFYEMESSAGTPRAEPQLVAVDSDFALHRLAIEKLNESFSSDRWLPFFVLTDGHKESCLPLFVTSAGNWTLTTTFDEEQKLRLQIQVAAGQGTTCEMAPKLGDWTAGLEVLRTLREADKPEDLGIVWQQIDSAYRRAVTHMPRAPELDFLLAIQDDWLTEDAIDGSNESYREAIENHLNRASDLLVQQVADNADPAIKEIAERLLALRQVANSATGSKAEVYLQTRLLKRNLLLTDPRVCDGPLLFCKRKPPSWSHLVAQYYGWRQRPGGGLFILEQPGRGLRLKDVLGNQLPQGNILEPCLSYDGKRIVFSFGRLRGRPVTRPGRLQRQRRRSRRTILPHLRSQRRRLGAATTHFRLL